MSKAEKAWCVRSPRGRLMIETMATTMRDAIAWCLEGADTRSWPELHDAGYRCVKVTVKEGWER